MIVLITGAYGGIGRAACFAYAKQATTLFITGKDPIKLDLLANELQHQSQATVYLMVADINCEQDIKNIFQSIAKKSKRLDVMLHCAGMLTQQPLMMTRYQQIQQEISTNLTSAIVFCQYASKLMLRNKQGVITLLSSIVANQGSAGQSVYGASKAGIEGLVKSLAKELGASGVRINAIAPGFIETAMVEQFTAEDRLALADKTSLKRLGQVEDIIPLCQFLSSNKASFITGQIIGVDGGLVL